MCSSLVLQFFNNRCFTARQRKIEHGKQTTECKLNKSWTSQWKNAAFYGVLWCPRPPGRHTSSDIVEEIANEHITPHQVSKLSRPRQWQFLDDDNNGSGSEFRVYKFRGRNSTASQSCNVIFPPCHNSAIRTVIFKTKWNKTTHKFQGYERHFKKFKNFSCLIFARDRGNSRM